MRSSALTLAIALWIPIAHGCTSRQARVAHRAGEIATAGGLIGVLVTGVGAALVPSQEDTLTTVGVLFVPVAVLGALLYISTDGAVNRDRGPKLTRRERNQLAAWELTKQAATAARERDCTQVQAIAPRVFDLDHDFHKVVFMRDVAIQRCLRER
jgi:hypothetical protein